MADKTTTLKTKTNDNVYPNIIGDYRDNAIVNSAHINHTLTADHKINFRLDTNVSKLIFNSLQKPKGLTKTKLVGVGTNGQENIEIGDNLTLANGKLSASGGGGGGSTIRITYTLDLFNWDPPSSDRTFNVGDYGGTYSKTLDENELPLQLHSTSITTIGTATFIIMPVQWVSNNIRSQSLDLVCIKSGTVPANTQIRIYVDRVRVVSE